MVSPSCWFSRNGEKMFCELRYNTVVQRLVYISAITFVVRVDDQSDSSESPSLTAETFQLVSSLKRLKSWLNLFLLDD